MTFSSLWSLSSLLSLLLLSSCAPKQGHALQQHQHSAPRKPHPTATSASSLDRQPGGGPSSFLTSSSSSRRNFLVQGGGVTAAAAAAVTSSPLLGVTPGGTVLGRANAMDEIPSAGTIAAATTAPPAPVEVAVPSTTSRSPLTLPPMGLGCWSWGDSLFWGYNPKNDADLQQVFDYAITNHAPILVDTAELYGFGRSETLLGEYSKPYYEQSEINDNKLVVATKFAALPYRTSADSVVRACQASVRRLGGRPIDLYQIHFPGAWSNAAYWDGMAECYERGLIKSIGVSNYGVEAVRACHDALAKRDIPLATNQIQYSLLYRFPEQNGLLRACDDLGIKVLSYSPLALGLLTGKYDTVESLQTIQGPRKQLFRRNLVDNGPAFGTLLATMKSIAEAHSTESRTVTVPQVAINWCRAKGTVPIPGARNLRQIQSNYAALEWDLTQDELVQLDDDSANLAYITPQDSPMRLYDKELQLNMFDS